MAGAGNEHLRRGAPHRGARYRARQFFRAILAPVQAAEHAQVQARLSPAQMDLFRRMDRCDQRHCLDVHDTLYDAGWRDETLLQAALIHDVGKSGAGLTVWHRTLVVLMRRFAPRWLERLAADGRGWRAPLAVHVRHAELSARLAAGAGCSPQIVDLLRAHHVPDPRDERLAALQWADGLN